MRERIPWTQYFMMQALVISQRSTCDRALVGCVLARNKRVIATGYNGSVSGQPHCDDAGHEMIDGHCVRTIHSEMNALLQCAKYGISTADSEIYVTHFPCYNCAKALVQAGIKQVHYFYDYRDSELTINLFKDSGISYEKVSLEPKYFTELFKQLDQD
ncbi:MAG: deaminase [Lactobacillus sp.]|nr:deaminase [Lactobacillus sp.]